MNAIAGFSAASLAIRSCFVDTLSGFKAPSCFSKAILYYDAPLPFSGSARAAFPSIIGTIRALRLPVPNTGVAYIVRFPAPTDLSLRSLPCGGELRSGLVPFKPGTAGYHRLVNHRTSQVPGESILYLCPALRSRPVLRPSPSRRRRCSPHLADNEDTGNTEFSRLNHAASIPAAYASRDALLHPHARLASGRWLTFTGRESNPLDSIEKFPSST